MFTGGRIMCTLTQQEFFAACRCREELKKLLKQYDDAVLVMDKLKEKYDKKIISFILSSSITTTPQKKIEDWAKKYNEKVGFLSPNLKVKTSKLMIESLIYLVNKK